MGSVGRVDSSPSRHLAVPAPASNTGRHRPRIGSRKLRKGPRCPLVLTLVAHRSLPGFRIWGRAMAAVYQVRRALLRKTRPRRPGRRRREASIALRVDDLHAPLQAVPLIPAPEAIVLEPTYYDAWGNPDFLGVRADGCLCLQRLQLWRLVRRNE